MTAERPHRERFGSRQRIRRTGDFARIKVGGRRAVQGCLIANWSRNEAGGSRLGVVTSRKVGAAVVRSRARRLLRESFRRHQHDFLQAIDLILVARASIAGKSYQEVERDFLTTLRKAGLLRVDAGGGKA